MSRKVSPRPEGSPLPQEPWYLGLDPSLTGYGVVFLQPSTGAVRAHTIKTNAVGEKEPPGRRMHELHGALFGLFTAFPDVDIVCMEKAAFNASGAYTGGICHAITAFALLDAYKDKLAARPAMVVQSTLKKFASGRGVGLKSAMMMNVLKKWGFESENDNIADAYALARVAAALRSGSNVKYEAECIKTVLGSWQP